MVDGVGNNNNTSSLSPKDIGDSYRNHERKKEEQFRAFGEAVFKLVKPAFDIGIWLGTKIADAILDALEQDQQKQLTLAEHINRVFFDLPYSGSRDDLGTRQGITCGMALDENNAHRRKDRQDLVSSG